MNLFKRNQVFNQFKPLIEDLEEIKMPKKPKVTGIARLFKTNYGCSDIAKIATTYKMKVHLENNKSVCYKKLDGKHEVMVTYNKGDRSIMIAVARSR